MTATQNQGTRLAAYPFFLLIALLLLPLPAAAESPLQQLRQQVARRQLHQAPEWRALLHMRRYWWGERSVIDDPRFFLSPRGGRDPRAELDATVVALFGADPPDAPQDPRGAHPHCRFPARLDWLRQVLDVPAPEGSAEGCVELERAMERVAPRRATLVFPAAHINNPGSMFGHTLLRVDSQHDSALLSHAVNYAAEIGADDNGLEYAFKGLFGFYPGYFSVLPYYEKVNQYGAIEQRDIWEYRLNLTPEEVRRMTLHAWELRGMYSDYFFFDENCSFNLLYLLEVARPEVALTRRYGQWVTPLATVEDVIAAGLVEDTGYRPSLATTLQHTAAELGGDGVRLAQGVVRGTLAPGQVVDSSLGAEDQARVLDIAAQFEQMRLTQGDTNRSTYQQRYLEILGPRSKLPGVSRVAPDIPVPARPETGHSSSRIYTAVGVRGGQGLVEVGGRPAYHDVMDPDQGFKPGAQINFFDAALRFYPRDRRIRLQRFDPVNILSLSPRGDFFSPISFKIRAGLRSKPFARNRDGLVGALNGGGGFCWGSDAGLFYLLGEAEANASRRYGAGTAAAVGGSGGWLAHLSEWWQLRLEGRTLAYVWGAQQPDLDLALTQTARLARNHSLRLDARRTASSGVFHTQVLLRWNVYF